MEAGLDPRRGDWYTTAKHPTRIRCIEYSSPPSQCASSVEAYVATLKPGAYIGPVHEVQYFNRFVSVQVPSTEKLGTLVWVNLANGSTAFAELVPRALSGFLN